MVVWLRPDVVQLAPNGSCWSRSRTRAPSTGGRPCSEPNPNLPPSHGARTSWWESVMTIRPAAASPRTSSSRKTRLERGCSANSRLHSYPTGFWTAHMAEQEHFSMARSAGESTHAKADPGWPGNPMSPIPSISTPTSSTAKWSGAPRNRSRRHPSGTSSAVNAPAISAGPSGIRVRRSARRAMIRMAPATAA